MKIGEYKQMNAYLTRPGTPEQKKKAEENNAKYLAERKWTLAKFKEVLKSKERKMCAPPAPAAGLFLHKVIY